MNGSICSDHCQTALAPKPWSSRRSSPLPPTQYSRAASAIGFDALLESVPAKAVFEALLIKADGMAALIKSSDEENRDNKNNTMTAHRQPPAASSPERRLSARVS